MEGMNEALASLAAAAALVGAPASAPVPTPRAAVAPAPNGETTIARATLDAVSAAQAAGAATRSVDGSDLSAAMAFNPDGDAWFLLRSGARSGVFSEAALKTGAAVDLPGGRATLKVADAVLTVAGASGTSVEFREKDLLDALYEAAIKVDLGTVRYAVLHRDGRDSPASECLLRRDARGNYFVASYSPADARKATIWVVAVDGVLYGMRLRGPELIFVSKPLSAAARRP